MLDRTGLRPRVVSGPPGSDLVGRLDGKVQVAWLKVGHGARTPTLTMVETLDTAALIRYLATAGAGQADVQSASCTPVLSGAPDDRVDSVCASISTDVQDDPGQRKPQDDIR
jgi:hypothetical protein